MENKDNKMEKSIKEAIGKSLNGFNKKIGMAKLIKDNKNQDRILNGILSQVNDENTEKTEKSNVITLDNSTDGIIELQEIKGDTNVNVSKIEKETPITHVIDDKDGNVISLDGITEGAISIDNIQGNTMVNYCKDGSKELTLNGDIDTEGTFVTTTEGVDGGLVDVMCEGNTMVNVCDQEEPVTITKSYTVDTGNHVALQGEYDGKCRPVLNGNTLVNILPKFSTSSKYYVGGNKYNVDEEGYATINAIGDWIKPFNTNMIKNSNLKYDTIYTIICDVKENTLTRTNTTKNTVFDMCSNDVDEAFIKSINGEYSYQIGETGRKIITVQTKTKDELTLNEDKTYFPRTQVINRANSGYIKYRLIVLEGDYTNKPIPNYFTGLQSSFEDGYVPENLYKFSSRDDFYLLDANVILDGEYIKMTANSAYQNAVLKPLDTIKPSTTYTIVVDVVENTLDSMLYITSNSDTAQLPSAQVFRVDSGKTGIFTKIVTTSNNLSGCTRCLVNFLDNTNTTGSIKYRIMIVEGDYTNYDFTNYDSSKAGKYKVNYKVTGKNKLKYPYTYTTTTTGGITYTDNGDGSITVNGTATATSNFSLFTSNEWFLNEGTYTVSLNANKTSGVTFLIGGKNSTIKYTTTSTTTTFTVSNKNDNLGHCLIQVLKGQTIDNVTIKPMLEEGTTATTYEPYKEYNKTFYLNSPLLEGDTIEDINGKATHVHRYGKVVLDGSNYVPQAEKTLQANGYYRWKFSRIPNLGNSTSSNIGMGICDKYPTVAPNDTWNSTTEGITQNSSGNTLVLCLDRYKDGSDDSKASLIAELQQNPATVVYQLATPTYETISNDSILCDSYVNGHLDVDSVVPIDKVDFNSYGKGLNYLSPSTEYIIQFESDNNGILYALALNDYDTLSNLNIVKGINKFTITTRDKIKAKCLWTTGIGFNASNIVVTPKVEQTFGYFKGMKSVGQDDVNGHKIEILSKNKNIVNRKIIDMRHAQGTYITNDNGGHAKPSSIEYLPKGKYIFSIDGYNVSNFVDSCLYIWKGDLLFQNCRKSNITQPFEILDGEVGFTWYGSVNKGKGETITSLVGKNIQVELGETQTLYVEPKQNKKEILLNEPLKSLPNGVKDKIVLIDGKWYIERNCKEVIIDGVNFVSNAVATAGLEKTIRIGVDIQSIKALSGGNGVCATYPYIRYSNEDTEHIRVDGTVPYGNLVIWANRSKLKSLDTSSANDYLKNNPIIVIIELVTPTYEPLEVDSTLNTYNDTTHISNNSLIPCNMVIKNSGYNCILKPNTTYTVSSNNGLSSVVTKDSIGDSVLRFYDKDTSSITKMNNVLVLEGDYITGNPPIPAFFKGMESTFEQELVTDEQDKNYGKYKVNVKAVGKNLFDKDVAIQGYVDANGTIHTSRDSMVSDYIKVKPNTTYINNNASYENWAIYDDNKNFIKQGYLNPITTTANTSYIRVTVKPVSFIDKYQIEEGDKATEYESYKENNITFYLKEPLRGVGDVKDKVYVKEDKVVVERNCASITFDGGDDENWKISTNNNDNYTTLFFINDGIKKINNSTISDKFKTISSYMAGQPEGIKGDSLDINIRISNTKANTLELFKQWLQQNPTTAIYQLAEPYYEEVKYSNNRLILDSYDNSTLFYNSNIPVSNTSFKPLWEELVYVKNSTTYYIQFNAIGNGNVVVNLGGTELSTTITEGYNKIEITTPNKSTNLLTIDGQGIKINKVVISEALCGGYYKGLQSCFEEHMENGKYVCVIRGISLDGNKVNGIKFHLNEPLRGISDIKDRLCIKNNKLMVERNCEKVVFDGSELNWKYEQDTGNPNKTRFGLYNFDTLAKPNGVGLCSTYYYGVYAFEKNTFHIMQNGVRFYNNYNFENVNQWRKYLQENPITVVYQLQTPTYEEITNEYGLPIILEGYENGIVYIDSAITPTTSIKYTSNNTIPATLSNVDNLNANTQDDINNNIVTYMMDIDMMLTEMEMEDNASVMSLSDNDNNQNNKSSCNNILDRMNKEDRIKYQDNTTKMLEKVIKGKSLTKEENINRIDLYLSEGKIREEQSNYLKGLLKGGE